MKQLVFHVLFWMFSGGQYIRVNTEITVHQTFSKPHIKKQVSKGASGQLKEIDVSNPLFVFK